MNLSECALRLLNEAGKVSDYFWVPEAEDVMDLESARIALGVRRDDDLFLMPYVKDKAHERIYYFLEQNSKPLDAGVDFDEDGLYESRGVKFYIHHERDSEGYSTGRTFIAVRRDELNQVDRAWAGAENTAL